MSRAPGPYGGRPRGGGELADPLAVERLEAEHPEVLWRRREFLGRTAALAGLAGLAYALPSETLISQAARVQARAAPLPSPGELPIDTFVVLMMENRSFDHYLGWRPDADGRNAGLAYPDRDGNPIPTYHLPPDYQGCGHPDPDHGWDGGRWQLNRGRNDRFVTGNEQGTGSDEFAIGYYLEQDLPFMAPAAAEFQLYDRFFCSTLSSTYPNRHYMWGAQGGGIKTNEIPVSTLGHSWETIFDRAATHGVSTGYFASDLPFAALYGPRGFAWSQRVEEYYARAAAGTLPNITFVDPPFRDGGGGNGVSADDHPHGDIRLGQAFMSDVAHALIESPQWPRAALFIVYDEWGGFFDHVPPPTVPDDRSSRDHAEDWGQMGFRIPALAISPYAPRGRVSHATLGFESILKLISYRFGLGHLNRRHRYGFNIGRTLDFERPNFERPSLPDPGTVATSPCATGGSQGVPDPTGGQALPLSRPKQHDLVSLETSGYLERLGFEVAPATYESIYRSPDTVKRGFEGRD